MIQKPTFVLLSHEIRTKKDEGDDDEDDDDEEFEEDVSISLPFIGLKLPLRLIAHGRFYRTKKSTTRRPLRTKKKKLSLRTMMKSRNLSLAD
jgi:hypothetical protein